ncbi:MAG: AbgT family transporter [Fimbriimonadaceae bacterium]
MPEPDLPQPGAHRPEGVPPRSEDGARRKGAFDRFLTAVEWLGNLLPHPVMLFVWMCAIVAVLSLIGLAVGWQVADPRLDRAGEMIGVRNLLSAEGLRYILTSTVTNFTGFAPLGTVLVTMLGIGVAEKSGLISAVIRSTVLKAPKSMLTSALILAGVLSNTASELGYVVIIPLGGIIFYSVGRHPIVGMAAAFAGVSGGYSANMLIGTVDPLLAGITQEAAKILDPNYTVNPLCNWWFMASSTLIITVVGTVVTSRIVEPRLGPYDPNRGDEELLNQKVVDLGAAEKRGMFWALVSTLAILGLLAWALLPSSGPLRNPDPALSGDLLKSPILDGVVPILFVLFLVPSIVYGKIVGTIKNQNEAIDGMAVGMRNMGLYLVLVFFAAQFTAWFGWTNLGQIVSVSGADVLRASGFVGPEVFVGFILFCCFVNLMIGSASAQWAITAPIFVPMLMQLGYSPEVIQAAYRIGDSTTNIITPMMSYFGLILAVAMRYDRRLGIGTMIGTMLPYSIAFIVGWMIWFFVYVFVLGLPVGPGAPTMLTR